MNPPILIEADQLKELIQENAVCILDTRSEEEYARGHIPGAVNTRSLFTYLLREDEGGFPELVNHVVDVLESAGASNEDHIVIYEDAMNNGYGQSSRGWLLLQYLGHKNVQVLHGGFRSWITKGFKQSIEEPEVKPSKFAVDIDPSMMASKDEIEKSLSSKTVILDCRDQAEWVGASSSPYGIDFCPRKGRIPNARWLEWYDLMEWREGIPFLKSKDEMASVFEGHGISLDDDVIIYCFKGARASFVLVSMLIAGYQNVRNYMGSWNDWSRDFDMPIDDMFKY